MDHIRFSVFIIGPKESLKEKWKWKKNNSFARLQIRMNIAHIYTHSIFNIAINLDKLYLSEQKCCLYLSFFVLSTATSNFNLTRTFYIFRWSMNSIWIVANQWKIENIDKIVLRLYYEHFLCISNREEIVVNCMTLNASANTATPTNTIQSTLK